MKSSNKEIFIYWLVLRATCVLSDLKIELLHDALSSKLTIRLQGLAKCILTEKPVTQCFVLFFIVCFFLKHFYLPAIKISLSDDCLNCILIISDIDIKVSYAIIWYVIDWPTKFNMYNWYELFVMTWVLNRHSFYRELFLFYNQFHLWEIINIGRFTVCGKCIVN